ncbi:MAG: DNA-directed RNA polymerase subunit alpha, partial [Phycisphaerales bacterium JB041]
MLVIQRPTVESVDDAIGNVQRFAISPLEPGFGHTLGNSLRRTLLSSIPGTAITEVRFDDVLEVEDDVGDVLDHAVDRVELVQGVVEAN